MRLELEAGVASGATTPVLQGGQRAQAPCLVSKVLELLQPLLFPGAGRGGRSAATSRPLCPRGASGWAQAWLVARKDWNFFQLEFGCHSQAGLGPGGWIQTGTVGAEGKN